MQHFILVYVMNSDQSTAQEKAWTIFVRLNTGIVGSNPTRGNDVCVRLFLLYVQLAVLRRADAASKESYRLCI
jgi:hypothetical protein